MKLNLVTVRLSPHRGHDVIRVSSRYFIVLKYPIPKASTLSTGYVCRNGILIVEEPLAMINAGTSRDGLPRYFRVEKLCLQSPWL